MFVWKSSIRTEQGMNDEEILKAAVDVRGIRLDEFCDLAGVKLLVQHSRQKVVKSLLMTLDIKQAALMVVVSVSE